MENCLWRWRPWNRSERLLFKEIALALLETSMTLFATGFRTASLRFSPWEMIAHFPFAFVARTVPTELSRAFDDFHHAHYFTFFIHLS
jgi:hypothetical protein